MDPSAEPTTPSIDTALNLKQVARALDVHHMTAYRYVRHGRLRARRDGTMWLVDEVDLEEFRAGAAAPAAEASSSVDWPDRRRSTPLRGRRGRRVGRPARRVVSRP